MKLAMQQSQDLARTRKCIEAMLGGEARPLEKETKKNSEKIRPSPVKAKTDLKTHFSEPPAPPPQAPLPEKPDVARALADPLIQPLLRRADTAKPSSASSSPTRMDHSSDILRLCEELKLAKGELTSQAERMKGLESQLAHERTARESAEERAHQLLEGTDKSDLQDDENGVKEHDASTSDRGPAASSAAPELQAQLERLQATMDEMKQQMEAYRQRAESAESERDEARQSLAEMVEQKRKENAASKSRSRSRKRRGSLITAGVEGSQADTERPSQNGTPCSPTSSSTFRSPTATTLLERAGLALESGQAITPEQARIIQGLLSREVLGCSETTDSNALATSDGLATSKEGTLMYHGRPLTGAAFVVVLGVCLMGWMNSWPKLDR